MTFAADRSTAEPYRAAVDPAHDAGGGESSPPDESARGDAKHEADNARATNFGSVLSAWWQTRRALYNDMFDLAASEAMFAAIGLAQLFIGAIILVSLVTLALVCLQIALTLGLYALQLNGALIAVFLFALNGLLAFVVYCKLKSLRKNFEFKHTREMLTKPDPAAVDPLSKA